MTTRPHMRVEPAWLTDARAAWAPREDVPLRVTAWMRAPVAFDRDQGLRLEGALGWIVVAMVTGAPPREAFDGVRVEDYVDIPVPILDTEIAGWRVAMCSDAMLAPVAAEVVRRRRKKPHPEAMGLAKVQTTGGPWKALDIPTAAWVSPTLTWYLRGDPARLRALLAELHALGRGRSGGLGHVDAWEVEPDATSLDAWRERPLPVASVEDAERLYPERDVRAVGVRAPFWHRAVRTLAACPVAPC